jgi:aspartyl-tRNA(Asn)/glutamyl-tRNA(Gln) amidotransferase subunit A
MPGELTWMPAWQIRELIGKREVAPTEVVEHFLGRIEQHDGRLHSFAHLDAAGARQQAKRAEQAILQGQTLGPLHGIPIAAKEEVPIKGMPLKPRPGLPVTISDHDVLAVTRLREAGAIIVGTTTMLGSGGGGFDKQWFNWDVEARNPWDTDRTAGWSSAGSAAATVAGLIPIAIGTDGGGSTRLPAAYSGAVGVHPTAGLIPIVDYDTPRVPPLTLTRGPICRDVLDAAITLQVMAGPDGRDFTCIQAQPPDMISTIEAGVDGTRLAWTDDFGYTDMYALDESPRVIAHARRAAEGLRAVGATLTPTAEVWEDPTAAAAVTNWLFGVAIDPNNPLPAPSTPVWAAAMETRQRNWARFMRLFGEFDLLISPTSQLLAPTVETWDARWLREGNTFPHGSFGPTYTSHTTMFNWLCFPAVSVPCGFVDGLPVGLQIVGPPSSEDKIFRVALAFQRAFPQDGHPPDAG